jgi:hypothetical protein
MILREFENLRRCGINARLTLTGEDEFRVDVRRVPDWQLPTRGWSAIGVLEEVLPRLQEAAERCLDAKVKMHGISIARRRIFPVRSPMSACVAHGRRARSMMTS